MARLDRNSSCPPSRVERLALRAQRRRCCDRRKRDWTFFGPTTMFSLPRLLDRPLGRSKFPTYKNDPSQWEMRQQFPAAKPIAAFGREHNGSFVCFDKVGGLFLLEGHLSRIGLSSIFSGAVSPRSRIRSCEIFLREKLTAGGSDAAKVSIATR
jgi:hypothetical protein